MSRSSSSFSVFLRIGFAGVAIGIAIAAAIALFVANREGIGVPPEKREFVANWSSESDYLRVSSMGRLDLEINGPSKTLSISNGWIASFSNGQLCVGSFWPFEPDCLGISEAPYMVDGDEMAIRVDGVELRRR